MLRSRPTLSPQKSCGTKQKQQGINAMTKQIAYRLFYKIKIAMKNII